MMGQGHTQPWIILKEKATEKETESGEEPSTADEMQLHFEDVKMEQVRISDV